MGRKSTIKVNDKYGYLTVLEILPTIAGKHSRVKVVCDCGNIKTVQSHLLKTKIKSCGCMQYKNIDRSNWNYFKLDVGIASRNALYSQYKHSAERRGFIFELEISDFEEITKQNCFYCGIEPLQIYHNSKIYNGDYLYNGIDRIDNIKGYTRSNVRTCCFMCNRAKHALTEHEFYNWIDRLIEHRRNSLLTGAQEHDTILAC